MIINFLFYFLNSFFNFKYFYLFIVIALLNILNFFWIGFFVFLCVFANLTLILFKNKLAC